VVGVLLTKPQLMTFAVNFNKNLKLIPTQPMERLKMEELTVVIIIILLVMEMLLPMEIRTVTVTDSEL
jgi:hypothetical protein